MKKQINSPQKSENQQKDLNENNPCNIKAINLLDNKNAQSYRKSFKDWCKKMDIKKINSNPKFDLNIGDVIMFKNGYGIPMISEIIGFNNHGDAYMLWDCYWFPINLNTRFIQKV